MTKEEIIADKQKVRDRINVLKEELTLLNNKLEYGYQKICPHPESDKFDSWGQYLPSETICGLCNKVLK
jgi:hypothetical protein